MPCTAFPPVFTYTLPLPYGRLCQCCDTQEVYPLEGLAAIVPSGQSELNIIWPGGRSTQMPCTAFPPVFTYTLPLPYG
ncbi:hypothetical protein AOLI_G00327650 [Acnodon oligacanthus]